MRVHGKSKLIMIITASKTLILSIRLEERIIKLKKNQERRVNRKNAKAVKEGGATVQLKRTIKTETTVRTFICPRLATDISISETLWSLRTNGAHE